MNRHTLNILRNLSKFPKVAIVVLLLALLLVAAAYAASPGSLDTGFDVDGTVTTPFGDDNAYGYAVAIQSDGQIVVAGYTNNEYYNQAFALARYTITGTLDTTFGTDGKVSTPDPSGNDYGYAVAIQADGKIVVAGYSHNGSNDDFALARYNSDGNLDTTFGTAGKVTTPIGSESDVGKAVAIQADGQIAVAGESNNGSNYDFALARYTITGTLDTGFGTDGTVTTPIGSGNDYGYAVAIQSDGKIVVAGVSNNGSNDTLALVRYTITGTLDTTFDTDGTVTTSIGSYNEGYAVAIQADGQIVVAGYSNNGSNDDFALARYTSDGSLDTTFDGDGVVTTPIGSSGDEGYAVAIQAHDGKIVVAGVSNNGSNREFALARYDVAESITETVANGGTSTTLPGVTITNTSGTPCDFTVVKIPVPPGGIPATLGEMPIQWNITSTCNPLTVTLVFSYTDTELANGKNITETNLTTFKHTGGTTWTNQCGTYTCTLDTGANTLTVSDVTALSSWTLGDPTSGVPTAIRLQNLAPRTARTGVNVPIVLSVGVAVLGLVVIGVALTLRRRSGRRSG